MPAPLSVTGNHRIMSRQFSPARGALFVLTLFAGPASACDFCLMHQGISPLETLNGHGLRVTQHYTDVDAVYQGTDRRPDPGAEEQFWTTDITAFYSLPQLEGLLLQFNLPVRVTRGAGDVRTAADGSVDRDTAHGGDSGIGDVSLLARYTFLRRHTLASTLYLALSAGFKAPTGATDGRDDAGAFMDAHTQVGTGSYDALVGLSGNYVRGRFGVAVSAFGSLTGAGEFGDTRHRFGDSLNYAVSGRYRLTPAVLGGSAMQLFAAAGISGEARRREHEEGARVTDSGGHTLYVTPGLQLNVNAHWVAEVSYHHAIYHRLNGTQLGENYKVFGSLTYLF